ncbi:MAG: hypothetical protein NC489_08830 [Ruminococcus flavefaciens]|nr:hypothetical protein [Ruminococcus flavefaciens]
MRRRRDDMTDAEANAIAEAMYENDPMWDLELRRYHQHRIEREAERAKRNGGLSRFIKALRRYFSYE